jgi:osmotically-inducible protein OsmY
MIRSEEVVGAVLATLEREPRVNLHGNSIDVRFEDGVVTLTGEVDGIAAKKLALELAAAPRPVNGVVDRLRVAPAEHMEDGAIRDHVCDALLSENSFQGYSIQAIVKQDLEPVRSLNSRYELEVEVSEGVVTLSGQVESISHKRMAGVLAWWVPGSRDVLNGLELAPQMEDNDDEVADILRLVLEKDPMVNASQLRLSCRNLVVTLEGAVSTESAKSAAESDAWYLFGVNGVVNRITVLS